MSDDIGVGGVRADVGEPQSGRHLVPIQVGEATVWVEQREGALIDPGDAIHPVAPTTPQQAFESAGSFLRECVAVFDQRIRLLPSSPTEISIEFSLDFETRGKATLIPVFLTGESSVGGGIKVTAVWRPADARPSSKDHEDAARP